MKYKKLKVGDFAEVIKISYDRRYGFKSEAKISIREVHPRDWYYATDTTTGEGWFIHSSQIKQ